MTRLAVLAELATLLREFPATRLTKEHRSLTPPAFTSWPVSVLTVEELKAVVKMSLEIGDRKLFSQRVGFHQTRIHMLDQRRDEFMKKLYAKSTTLRGLKVFTRRRNLVGGRRGHASIDPR